MTKKTDTLITYPSDFPIKVMGPKHDKFIETMVQIVTEHDATLKQESIEIRPSANGNYISLTFTVRAISREQLDNLYRTLTSHPMVKIVL